MCIAAVCFRLPQREMELQQRKSLNSSSRSPPHMSCITTVNQIPLKATKDTTRYGQSRLRIPMNFFYLFPRRRGDSLRRLAKILLLPQLLEPFPRMTCLGASFDVWGTATTLLHLHRRKSRKLLLSRMMILKCVTRLTLPRALFRALAPSSSFHPCRFHERSAAKIFVRH